MKNRNCNHILLQCHTCSQLSLQLMIIMSLSSFSLLLCHTAAQNTVGGEDKLLWNFLYYSSQFIHNVSGYATTSALDFSNNSSFNLFFTHCTRIKTAHCSHCLRIFHNFPSKCLILCAGVNKVFNGYSS